MKLSPINSISLNRNQSFNGLFSKPYTLVAGSYDDGSTLIQGRKYYPFEGESLKSATEKLVNHTTRSIDGFYEIVQGCHDELGDRLPFTEREYADYLTDKLPEEKSIFIEEELKKRKLDSHISGWSKFREQKKEMIERELKAAERKRLFLSKISSVLKALGLKKAVKIK